MLKIYFNMEQLLFYIPYEITLQHDYKNLMKC